MKNGNSEARAGRPLERSQRCKRESGGGASVRQLAEGLRRSAVISSGVYLIRTPTPADSSIIRWSWYSHVILQTLQWYWGTVILKCFKFRDALQRDKGCFIFLTPMSRSHLRRRRVCKLTTLTTRVTVRLKTGQRHELTQLSRDKW